MIDVAILAGLVGPALVAAWCALRYGEISVAILAGLVGPALVRGHDRAGRVAQDVAILAGLVGPALAGGVVVQRGAVFWLRSSPAW